MRVRHSFRVVWPIRNPQAPLEQIADEVRDDLPALALQAHARIVGNGRFWIAPASKVPGSGGMTATVLVYDAPAVPTRRRVYHR